MGRKEKKSTVEQYDEIENLGSSEDEVTIDLSEIFYLLWKHATKIILCLVVGCVVALMVTVFMITPQYTATSKMYILSSGKNSVVDLSSLQVSSQLTADYKELITSRPLLEDVITNLNLKDLTVRDITSMITIDNPADTRILTISVQSDDPKLSADIANEVSVLAKEYLPRIMNTEEPSIYEKAVVPQSKSSPSTTKNTLLGGIGLAGLYVIILIVRYVMNDTFTTPEDISRYFGIQPLAAIPENRKNKRKKTKKGGKK